MSILETSPNQLMDSWGSYLGTATHQGVEIATDHSGLIIWLFIIFLVFIGGVVIAFTLI